MISQELQRLGLKTKRAVTRGGRVTGDLSFTRGHPLYRLLSNPIYVGAVPCAR